jgi:hypothetical protein
MAIIKMSSQRKLDLKELREMMKAIGTRKFYSGQTKLVLGPVRDTAAGKGFATGYAVINNKRLNIFACQCEFSDGTQGMTLRKEYRKDGDTYIDDATYAALDKIFLKVLKMLLCKFLNTTIDRIEFTNRKTEYGLGQSVIVAIKSGRPRNKNENQLSLNLLFA